MGRITDFFFGNTAGGIAEGGARGLLSGLGDFATKIRSAITGDLPPEMQVKLTELALQAEQMQTVGQLQINQEEAKNPHLFVAGWRPFMGWVCGVAIGWNFVIYPFVVWYMAIRGMDAANFPPMIPLAGLWPVILGMLGLGGLRTVEKAAGINSQH